MNAKMLMLGILLIAGLSFAVPNNWMANSVNRYGCNYYYNDDGWDGDGLYDIADDYDDGYWNFGAMNGYLEDMRWAIWDEGSSEMCYYSGCWEGGEGTSATNFRSSMLEYNAAAAGYRAEFLAGLRAYLADGNDRAPILADMRDAMADYRDCLEYIAEEKGPCYMCLNV